MIEILPGARRVALVGHTGFVGSALERTSVFHNLYRSTNIRQIREQEFELVVYSGVRSQKFLANLRPEEDWAHVEEALDTIRNLKTQRLVLISTVDVYTNPSMGDETTTLDPQSCQPYGRHRLLLEREVLKLQPKASIVRLPALFGQGLKKNFLFDILHELPAMMPPEVHEEAVRDLPALAKAYAFGENRLWNLVVAEDEHKRRWTQEIAGTPYAASGLTHPESTFQFFPLDALAAVLAKTIEHHLPLVTVATAPLTASDIYQRFRGRPMPSSAYQPRRVSYDLHSIHSQALGGAGPYLESQEDIGSRVDGFLRESRP